MLSKRVKLIGGGAVAGVVLAAAAGFGVWWAMVPHDTPEAVNLASAVQSMSTATTTASDAAPSSADKLKSDLTGTWVIPVGSESFVGYRVKEELARIGATTAVGRTKQLTGALKFNGTTITDVEITADLTSLQSDESRRDNALKQQALEINKFPTAAFKLTKPIAIANIPAEGEQVTMNATGDLTIHGVTRQVSLDLQGQRTNNALVVVGNTPIQFADYSIATPRSFAVLSVEDHGILELQVVFQKDASQT